RCRSWPCRSSSAPSARRWFSLASRCAISKLWHGSEPPMCGIIGCLQPAPVDGETLGLAMLEQIRYRGPDAGYLHLEDEIVLGSRRLAIINVEHGAQPTFSADGDIVAVFNGEIYNHRELRKELTAYGYVLRDGSDAEVIPHAYHKWGVDFPSHFNGD